MKHSIIIFLVFVIYYTQLKSYSQSSPIGLMNLKDFSHLSKKQIVKNTKKLKNPKTNKASSRFQIKIYYRKVVTDDGKTYFIPMDETSNHYFIG